MRGVFVPGTGSSLGPRGGPTTTMPTFTKFLAEARGVDGYAIASQVRMNEFLKATSYAPGLSARDLGF